MLVSPSCTMHNVCYPILIHSFNPIGASQFGRMFSKHLPIVEKWFASFVDFCTSARFDPNYSHFQKKINLNQRKHLWPPVPQRGILTYCQYEKRWLTGREFVQICKITFVLLQLQIIFQVQKFSNHVHQGCQF